MASDPAGVHVTRWGAGPRVLLIHGGGPGGAVSFAAQEPLAARFELVLPDRPGHGQSPPQGREDFERDAELLLPLLEDGAHLVGHSYGGVIALVMATGAPLRVRTLTLMEPPAFSLAPEDPAVAETVEATRRLFSDPPPEPRERLKRFFEIVGRDQEVPDPLPPPLVQAADELLKVRAPEEACFDPAPLRESRVPVLVLSSGRHAGFEAVARALVDRAAATHQVVPGTDHLVQNAGEKVNPLLEAHWDCVR